MSLRKKLDTTGTYIELGAPTVGTYGTLSNFVILVFAA